MQSNVVMWMRAFNCWDYSEKNIKFLNHNGINNVKKFSFGWQPELNRISRNGPQDIDVLFYGSMNSRRLKIIDGLKSVGLRVENIFGVYGLERDSYISRSKLVLNMHYYDSHIFEVVRVFYLLQNGVPVCSEVNPSTEIDSRWISGVSAVPYDNIVYECKRLIDNDSDRLNLGYRGLSAIREFNQVDVMRHLLET